MSDDQFRQRLVRLAFTVTLMAWLGGGGGGWVPPIASTRKNRYGVGRLRQNWLFVPPAVIAVETRVQRPSSRLVLAWM